ncbi:MAG: META domain-containing protein [Thiomicrospira sp.]|jgi:heat shock protein HslJ|nr:META domain-containing protein [Thiomicrospira sp.]
MSRCKTRWGILGVLVLLLSACSAHPPASSPLLYADASREALDWSGTYMGVWPYEAQAWQQWELWLNADLSYRLVQQPLAHSAPPRLTQGRFEWDAQGRSISLMGAPLSGALLVGENRLFLLDAQGARYGDARAPSYELEKVASQALEGALFNQAWQLSERDDLLRSTPQAAKPYFMLNAQTLAVSGFSGCNRFFGRVELATEQGLRFRHLAMTKMACASANVEASFLQTLAQVAFWRMNEQGLLLLDSAQRPLLQWVTTVSVP